MARLFKAEAWQRTDTEELKLGNEWGDDEILIVACENERDETLEHSDRWDELCKEVGTTDDAVFFYAMSGDLWDLERGYWDTGEWVFKNIKEVKE